MWRFTPDAYSTYSASSWFFLVLGSNTVHLVKQTFLPMTNNLYILRNSTNPQCVFSPSSDYLNVLYLSSVIVSHGFNSFLRPFISYKLKMFGSAGGG